MKRNPGLGTFLFCLTFIVFSCTSGFAQTSAPEFPERTNVPEVVSFFAPFVFPKVMQDGVRLKEYIRSEEFAEFKQHYGDIYALDAVFDEAMRLSWNNAYEALLLSFIATMDHSKFGVRLPIVGPILWVPLTSEFEDEFRARVNALPGKLYDDSPAGLAGDRDKLQHFFGSAFLAYVFESRQASERVGEFIEWGEDKVIVDGALDERDFRANRQGQEFGLGLLDDSSVMPSSFLRFSLVRDKDSRPAASSDSCIELTDPEVE